MKLTSSVFVSWKHFCVDEVVIIVGEGSRLGCRRDRDVGELCVFPLAVVVGGRLRWNPEAAVERREAERRWMTGPAGENEG